MHCVNELTIASEIAVKEKKRKNKSYEIFWTHLLNQCSLVRCSRWHKCLVKLIEAADES